MKLMVVWQGKRILASGIKNAIEDRAGVPVTPVDHEDRQCLLLKEDFELARLGYVHGEEIQAQLRAFGLKGEIMVERDAYEGSVTIPQYAFMVEYENQQLKEKNERLEAEIKQLKERIEGRTPDAHL